jgi:hypothetical protein
MQWWQIIVFLIIICAAYSAGHWVGYGKGEQDTRELTEEIKQLSKKHSRNLRRTIKAQPHRARDFRKALNHRLDAGADNQLSERVVYKTISRR